MTSIEALVIKPSTDRPPSPTRRSSRRSTLSMKAPSPVVTDARQTYDSPFDANLAVARKRAQHERLWELFATYALQMSSEDPTRMRVKTVCKLLQDCGVIDSSPSDEAKLIEKEVKIVCDSFLKLTPSDRDNTKRMDFTAFLGLLLHFAHMSGDADATRAFDSLVQTCLEKQQKPRVRTSVVKDMQACRKVLQAFDEPLTKLFHYFASQSHAKLEKLDPKMAQLSPLHMGYAECLTFARTYGVIAHGVLTTTEFATLYIDALTKTPAVEYERVLTADGFRELLVRVSQRACPGDHLSAERKLKGLFQLMWLASSSTSPRALKITDVLKTDKVEVTKLFLLHFEKFWKRENYENYVGDRAASVTALGETSTGSDEIAGASLDSPSCKVIPPGAPMRRGLSRRLSLCVQTTGGDGSGQPKTIQRRFSIQPPSSP